MFPASLGWLVMSFQLTLTLSLQLYSRCIFCVTRRSKPFAMAVPASLVPLDSERPCTLTPYFIIWQVFRRTGSDNSHADHHEQIWQTNSVTNFLATRCASYFFRSLLRRTTEYCAGFPVYVDCFDSPLRVWVDYYTCWLRARDDLLKNQSRWSIKADEVSKQMKYQSRWSIKADEVSKQMKYQARLFLFLYVHALPHVSSCAKKWFSRISAKLAKLS